jgi:uncharacterized ferritin-like protein (DUF455 family)
VATGVRWFEHFCAARGLDPRQTFRDRVKRHFIGLLKPPFNRDARDKAGFAAAYYEFVCSGEEPCAAASP